MRFVDTNVLLYAVSSLPEDGKKRRRARELLREQDLAVSVQVFQEFFHQATRHTRPERLSDADAIAFLGTLLKFRVQDLTLALFRDAVAISRRFKLSYWDGAILAAARATGCDVVYSEDLNDGQDYDGLRVVNPFSEIERPVS